MSEKRRNISRTIRYGIKGKGMDNKNIVLMFLALIILLLSGCAGSPNHTLSLNSEQIKQVSDVNICYAASLESKFRTPTIMGEISRRGIDCKSVLAKHNRKMKNEPLPADLTSGACKGIELMGIYSTQPVYGVKHYFGKVRNNSSTARIVTIWYRPMVSSSMSVRDPRLSRNSIRGENINLEVNPGRIAEVKLSTSDRSPKGIRIIRCQ